MLWRYIISTFPFFSVSSLISLADKKTGRGSERNSLKKINGMGQRRKRQNNINRCRRNIISSQVINWNKLTNVMNVLKYIDNSYSYAQHLSNIFYGYFVVNYPRKTLQIEN